MSCKTSGSTTTSTTRSLPGTVEQVRTRRRSPCKVGESLQKKKRKKTIAEIFEETKPEELVIDSFPPSDTHKRFLTHKKIMQHALMLVKHLCHVTKDGAYSLPLPFDKLMILVSQDAEDENGNFIGKNILWMQLRKLLFWTASKPSNSSYGVDYFHRSVVSLLLNRIGIDRDDMDTFAPFVQPTQRKICDITSLWNALVSFKEKKENFTPLGKFRMQHGTMTEDTAIVEFLKQFRNVVACEEYLHIFNASTRDAGFSVGTSPDGLLLWYNNDKLSKVTSLEVKCPGTCTNKKCKDERKKRAEACNASLEDEGFFCQNKAHFKAHSCIKTNYVVQMQLEMLGANTTENVYVSMGYNAKGVPVVKAYEMKFHLPALIMGVVYMRSLADLKNFAKASLAAITLQRWWRGLRVISSKHSWFEEIHDCKIYQRLTARVHQNYESMKAFSENASMGAHDSFAHYNKVWRSLTETQKDSVRNAKKLEAGRGMREKACSVSSSTYNDLTQAWLNSANNHPVINFKSPDTIVVAPLSQQAFEVSYTNFYARDVDTHTDVSHKPISRSEYLKLCVPQGVLTDEFYFCGNNDDDFIYTDRSDPASSIWKLQPGVDDGVVQLKNVEGEYRVFLRRIGYDQSFKNPLAETRDSDSHSDSMCDLASGLDEYYTSEDEDFSEQILSLEDRAAFALLLQMETDGLSVEDWLVMRTGTERAALLEKIAALTGWKRIVCLPSINEIQANDGKDIICQQHVSAENGMFHRLFPPPLSRWKKTWTFTRYMYARKKPWEKQRKMLAPPRIGGYDDEGNIFVNMLGNMDSRLPQCLSSIPRGAKIKVAVSDVWQSTCSFHTVLLHKDWWNDESTTDNGI